MAKYLTWGLGENKGVAWEPLKFHRCTPEELGVVEGKEDESSFYPIHANSFGDVKYYAKKFFCFDDDIEIQGDYNSARARLLKMSFEVCDKTVPENDCASDEEIAGWLRRKFIVILQNQVRFQTSEYDH